MMPAMKTNSNHRALLLTLIVSALSVGNAFTIALALGMTVGPGAPAQAMARSQGIQQTDRGFINPPAGRALFVQSCAHCHGDDASGTGEDGDGPDLHGLRISNARIVTVIRSGIPGEMPSFAKKYSASDIAALTGFLRTLR
jgi:mono/diheme cytochrome c family protein